MAASHRDPGPIASSFRPLLPGPRQSQDLSGSYHQPRWPGLVAGSSACGVGRATGDERRRFATLPRP